MKFLRETRQRWRHAHEPWMIHQHGKAFESESFPPNWIARHRIPATLEEMVMKVDLHWTRLGAGAAQRGGIRKMFPVLETT
jgi:hypothetical protein